MLKGRHLIEPGDLSVSEVEDEENHIDVGDTLTISLSKLSSLNLRFNPSKSHSHNSTLEHIDTSNSFGKFLA